MHRAITIKKSIAFCEMLKILWYIRKKEEAQSRYPFTFINIVETFELIPRGLLVRKLSKVVEFERRVVAARQQVGHPVKGDSAEERRNGVHIGIPRDIGSPDGVLPGLLHLTA